MPFKSKSQRRLFYAKEERGELPKGTAAKWEAHTPHNKPLPEHVKQAFMFDIQDKLRKGSFAGEMARTIAVDIPLDIAFTGGGYLIGKKLHFPRIGAVAGYLGGYVLPTAINIHRMTKKAFVLNKLANWFSSVKRPVPVTNTVADSSWNVASTLRRDMPARASVPAALFAKGQSLLSKGPSQNVTQSLQEAVLKRRAGNLIDTAGFTPGLKDTLRQFNTNLATGEGKLRQLTYPDTTKPPQGVIGLKSYADSTAPFMRSASHALASKRPEFWNKNVIQPYNVKNPKDTLALYPTAAPATRIAATPTPIPPTKTKPVSPIQPAAKK